MVVVIERVAEFVVVLLVVTVTVTVTVVVIEIGIEIGIEQAVGHFHRDPSHNLLMNLLKSLEPVFKYVTFSNETSEKGNVHVLGQEAPV